jgi:hypothetical protein
MLPPSRRTFLKMGGPLWWSVSISYNGGMHRHADSIFGAAPMSSPSELKILHRLAVRLAKARNLTKIKTIRDHAEAARSHAENAGLGLQVQNYAAEVRIRAERRAGQLLTGLVSRGGDRRSNRHDARLKLFDLGTNESQSTRWKLLAAIPDRTFEHYLADANERGEKITTKGLLRIARVGADTGKKGCGRQKGAGTFFSASQISHSTESKVKSAGRDSDQAGAARIMHDAEMLESFAELTNHCRLATSIVMPDSKDPKHTLSVPDRRTVVRLLADIHRIAASLWAATR